MRRFALRVLATAVALVVSVFLAIILLAYLPQADELRRSAAEQALSQLWGEPVSIRGAVTAELWPRAKINVAGVAAEGAHGARAQVDQLAFSVSSYDRLIQGTLRYGLDVAGAQFDVPIAGTADARPGSLLASPIYILSLLPHLTVRDTEIRLGDAETGWIFALKMADLKNAVEDGRNVLAAEAVLNNQPLTLGFAFDLSVEKGEGNLPYGAQISLASSGTSGGFTGRLDIRAPTVRFDHGLVVDVSAEASSIAQALRLAAIAPSIDGTGTLRAHLAAARGRVAMSGLDLKLALASGEHVAVTGSAADLATLDGANLKVVADLDTGAPSAVSLRSIVVTRLTGAFASGPDGMMLDDILIETNAFDQNLREIGPVKVRSVERDPEGHVAFKGISAVAGPPERPLAKLAGNVNDVLSLSGVDLSGSVDIPVASVLALPEDSGNKLGRFVGSLSVSDADGGLGVDAFTVRIDDSELIEANLGLVLDNLAKPNIATSIVVDSLLRIPNYAALAAALGDTSDFKGLVKFEGRLSGNTDELTMDGRTDIGRTQIKGALTSLAAPGGRSMVKGSISSPLVHGDEILKFLRPEQPQPRKGFSVKGARAPEGGSQIDLLGTTDADIAISATRLEGGGDTATGIEAHLTANNGALRVSPLRIHYRGGTLSAVIESEGRSLLRAKGSGEGWPLSSVLGRNSSISVTGTLHLAFDLTAQMGAHDLLGTLGGTLTARVGRGKLGTGLLDLAGVGLFAGLFTSSVYKGESALRCAKVPLLFQKGVGRTHPLIVVRTENVQALASGTVDLARNRIDLRVVPRPLNALNGDAGHSFTVKGPLSHPAIALATGGADLRGNYGCD
ncbi:AsmA-like C-terminal region-containing protein [Xanthobacter tagetidis]|nr:AsmA-like C-terminal region-containing protein [Xanthobacter tagetidis]MBB6309577.1 hypothetical protein [Xanthobacter tagetidis]